MKRLLVWSSITLAGLALLCSIGLAAGYLWLRGSLPRTEGRLQVAALHAEVEVLRDADGIVTIRAQDEHDAAVALGYVHAQDRLWQMDYMRRTGAGRLSEVAGPITARLDRFLRTLGLYRAAQANLEHLSPSTVALLEAYSAGVNAFLDDPGGPWPLEFYLLRYRPEPWRPADSLVWGRLMALQLSGNWGAEALRARLATRLSPQQINFLWPEYPADAPVALGEVARSAPRPGTGGLRELLPWELAPKDASNAWVLDGKHTQSGRPLLANDLHLALGAPGIWYLARLELPDYTLAGATAPGVPFLLAGHNGHIAWGFTTTHSDTQDLFLERIAEDDPGRYLTPEGAQAFETRSERLAIRTEEPETLTIRETRHGPVISDVLGEAIGPLPQRTVVALAWPALRPDDRSAEALHAMNRAKTWPEFRAALALFHSPQQNVVYADVGGTIAFAAPARVPVRRRGDGRAPVPGWSGEFDWVATIPFDDLPVAVAPANGRIVVANNKIVPDDYPYLLTADWPEPYRAERITALLDAESKHTPQDSLRLQQDIVSLAARELLSELARAQPSTDRGRDGLAMLRAWDGSMDRDRPEPLLYYAWLRQLNRVLFADELGPLFVDFQHPRSDLIVRVLREGQAWCDDIASPETTEDCPSQLVAALEVALDELAVRFRRPFDRLRWGEAHRARFEHPVLSRVSVLGWLFDYAVETDGGEHTVNRAGLRFVGPPETLFSDIHGPGYRAVYDLADLDESRFMIATGQSGNPLSPLYGNLAERWRDGVYLKLSGRARVARQRLLLAPGPAG